MKKNKKNFYLVIIAVSIFCISIGYAAINRTLTITGNSEVVKNTWDLHFKNVMIKSGSVIATTEPIADNNELEVNFAISLNLPGDFYEFTVDVANEGTIDAMIESITKTPTLTATQAKYLKYIIEYQNGEQITTKQLVKKDSFVRLKVRVEYRNDITENDLPTETETINLGFTLNYIQADGTGTEVSNNGSTTLRFTVDETEYEYEDGMTWNDFIQSGYSQGEFSRSYDSISYRIGCVYTDVSNPTAYDKIDGSLEYYSSICGRPDPSE